MLAGIRDRHCSSLSDRLIKKNGVWEMIPFIRGENTDLCAALQI
jgi:hypothetical protein